MVFVARRLHSDRDRYCGHGIQPGLSASSLTDLTALCGHHFRHTGAPADRGLLSLEGAADVGGGGPIGIRNARTGAYPLR
jgi:hypothetical protein